MFVLLQLELEEYCDWGGVFDEQCDFDVYYCDGLEVVELGGCDGEEVVCGDYFGVVLEGLLLFLQGEECGDEQYECGDLYLYCDGGIWCLFCVDEFVCLGFGGIECESGGDCEWEVEVYICLCVGDVISYSVYGE